MIPCLSPNGETTIRLDEAPTELLIGTATGVVKLRRDGATSPWREEFLALEGNHVGALINAPGERLFAGCHQKGGIFRSIDKGITWEQVGSGLTASDVFSLVVTAEETTTSIYAGLEPVNLYRSDDFGESWHELPAITMLPGGELWSFPPPPHLPHLKSMTVDPSHPNAFYGCVEQGALLKTIDGGATWVELDSMWRSDDKAYRDAHRLLVTPWDPRTLFFASGVGVYKSSDGGIVWRLCQGLNDRNAYPDVLVASSSDRTIFVGGPVDVPGDWPGGDPTGTICRSNDDGATWIALEVTATRGANFEALSIVEYPEGYSLFAGDTTGHIYASEDRGDSWSQIAATGAISKGAHFRLAAMSEKLPKFIGKALTYFFNQTTRVTMRRAAARRHAEFANRARR